MLKIPGQRGGALMVSDQSLNPAEGPNTLFTGSTAQRLLLRRWSMQPPTNDALAGGPTAQKGSKNPPGHPAGHPAAASPAPATATLQPRASELGLPQFDPNFTSDLGRKKFGFSREEIDATAYYEGQFKLWQRSGQGFLHFPETGDKYVGQFMEDAVHGEGRRVWSDGSEYTGQWFKGQKHGRGESMSHDGLTYRGQWENGRRHGRGVQEYSNGDVYDGWWLSGMCSGLGTYFFKDGGRFEGCWANGRYDGAGILIKADGSREKHVYRQGVLLSCDVLPSEGSLPLSAKSEKEPLSPRSAAKRAPIRKSWRTGTSKQNAYIGRQLRELMQKPTLLPRMVPSQHLIRRETMGENLSAPPLTERVQRLTKASEKKCSLSAREPLSMKSEDKGAGKHVYSGLPGTPSTAPSTAPANANAALGG